MSEIKGILFVIVNIIIIIAYVGFRFARFADREILKKHYKILFILLGCLFFVVFLLKKMS
jgi:hypothetical protein